MIFFHPKSQKRQEEGERKEGRMNQWGDGGRVGSGASYHSLGENVVSEEFLKFSLGLKKKEKNIVNSEYILHIIMINGRLLGS